MVASQSGNSKAVNILQSGSEKHMPVKALTSWDFDPTVSSFVSIDNDGTSLFYSGGFRGFRLSVKGNHPFPPGRIGKNFFEVEVLDHVENRNLCIGFCGEYVLHHDLPGSYCRSVGYSSSGDIQRDNVSIGGGREYSIGDVIGCCIDWKNRLFFFTVNGEQVGSWYCDLRHRIYPVIGFDGKDKVRISANFVGPFRYDMQGMEVDGKQIADTDY